MSDEWEEMSETRRKLIGLAMLGAEHERLMAERQSPREAIFLDEAITAMHRLITDAVEFELSARSLDRPDQNGNYPPEWYVAQAIWTRFNELVGLRLSKLTENEPSFHGDVV